MPLIPAEQARAQSDAFDLSQEQILEQVSSTINGHSSIGAKEVVTRFVKSAVSQQEMDGALETIRAGGYTVEMLANDDVQYLLKITW